MTDLEQTVKSFNEKTRIDFQKYKYLITPVGMSFQPPLCFCQAIKPSKVLFILTKETQNLIDTIFEQIQQWYNLKHSSIESRICGSTNMPAIYQAIREFCKDKNPAEILFDATAGKKAMTLAVTMAGELLGSDIAYLDYLEYDVEKRKPKLGTEYGILLETPLKTFYPIEEKKALAYLSRYDFTGALAILDELLLNLNEVGEIRELRDLTLTLQALDAFNYNEAEKCSGSMRASGRFSEAIRKDLCNAIGSLAAGDADPSHALYELANFYFAGIRNAGNGKYDLGVFMMYRVAERYAALLLKKNHNITAGVIYASAFHQETFENFKRLGKAVYGSKYHEEKQMPERVGFFDGFALLHALNDKVEGCKDDEKTIKRLKECERLSILRNKSIYAHGAKPLNKEDFENFQSFSKGCLFKYIQNYTPKITYNHLENIFLFEWLR